MGFKDWWKRLWCRDKYKKPSRPDVPREPVKPVKPVEGKDWWKPKLEMFQIIHLDDFPDFPELHHETRIVNTELDQLSKELVDKFHQSGIRVVAYFSAGYEDWREDADQYPASGKGNSMSEWDGEAWGNITDVKLREFLALRMKKAKELGCDAIEIDNTDAYLNDDESGVYHSEKENNLALQDLATRAHNLGLAIFLKNTLNACKSVHPYFDGVFNESGIRYNETEKFKAFVDSGKPVFIIEYKSKHCVKVPGAIVQYKDDYFDRDFEIC